MGRATQGVRLINIKGNDSIAAVAKVMKDEDDLEESEILDIEVNTEGATEVDDTEEKDGTEIDNPNTEE